MRRNLTAISLLLFSAWFCMLAYALAEPALPLFALPFLRASIFLLPLLWLRLPFFADLPMGERPKYSFSPSPRLIPLFFIFTGDVMLLSLLSGILIRMSGTEVPLIDFSGGVGWVLLTSVLIPAATEELFFRGAILRLAHPFGDGNAILFSALCFALFHFSLYQIPYALFAGAVLGFLCIRTRSVGITILFHLGNNLLSVLFSLPLFESIRSPLSLAWICASGILTFALPSVRREIAAFPSKGTALSAQTFGTMIFSPVLPVLCLLLCMAF